MNLRARRDPKEAVGGWNELGKLQFHFLCDQGLRPNHALLDIGCGSLRAGVHFIDYLAPGRSTGIDISDRILEAGRPLLARGMSEAKSPRLIRNRDLRSREFADSEFDFVLAQSVFTHMPLADIEECLASVGRVMRPGGQFFFTIFEAERTEYEPIAEYFRFPAFVIDNLCRLHGLTLERVDDFAHPRGQSMFRAAGD